MAKRRGGGRRKVCAVWTGMALKTRVTDILKVEVPIVQGGMHFVAYAELAAAVSNAGGLGVITALTQPDPEKLREEIKKVRKLTSKPFGVNVTLLPTLVPPNYDAYVDVILEEKVPVVETAGRNPSKIIGRLKQAGVIVIHKCVNVKHALTAERLGVDIISMDGFECAGASLDKNSHVRARAEKERDKL